MGMRLDTDRQLSLEQNLKVPSLYFHSKKKHILLHFPKKSMRRRGCRGWDGWMASLTQCTWAWANSGRWWWTGKTGVLQPMGSQRVRHHWMNKSNTSEISSFLIPKAISLFVICLELKLCCCCLSRHVTSASLWPGFSVHRDSLGKNTGVGCCFLLQGIFPTQGSNPHLLMSSALADEICTAEQLSNWTSQLQTLLLECKL